MKTELSKIAQDLEEGRISEDKARNVVGSNPAELKH